MPDHDTAPAETEEAPALDPIALIVRALDRQTAALERLAAAFRAGSRK